MDDYLEVLAYSEKQRALMSADGREPMVVLVSGILKPLLATETCTNQSHQIYGEEGEPRPTKKEAKSNWGDAVTIYRGDGHGYKRLVDGRGEVTEDGKAYCAAHHIEQTADALRAIAVKPRPGTLALYLPLAELDLASWKKNPGGPASRKPGGVTPS